MIKKKITLQNKRTGQKIKLEKVVYKGDLPDKDAPVKKNKYGAYA